jgi:two-component system chemotaxis sensor kinase CheA
MTMTEADELDGLLLAQMREDFLAESQEIIERLEPLLVRLESDRSPELLQTIFREMHTLKGSASFVGFDSIQMVAHKLEDIFGALRAKKLEVTGTLIDAIFSGVQLLTLLRAAVQVGRPAEEIEIGPVVAQLETALQGEATSIPLPAPDVPAPSQAPESTLRVRVETMDALMELVSELVTARNALLTLAEQRQDEALLGNAATIDRLTRQLYNTVTATRLLPVERLFNRFTGVVRNLARDCGKQVQLVVEGSDTPLDRTISEHIYDPLIHLLRNAIDHGLEPAQERRALGKPEQGTVRLSAERRGDNILLRVADDGRGINSARIRQKALELGLRPPGEIAGMSDEQVIQLIFVPGFSTAPKVTDLSGRGVGMDVIVEMVRRLRGTVGVSTARGQGTTFTLNLPLTLAILQAQMVRVNQYIYALPMHAVRETLRLPLVSLQTIQQQDLFFIRGTPLPVYYLGDWLGHPATLPKTADILVPAVVLRRSQGDVVMIVDELVGKQQVVIKPLSAYLGKVAGVEGAAVLPDGSVTLILDAEELVV